jgi:hypothetical protein
MRSSAHEYVVRAPNTVFPVAVMRTMNKPYKGGPAETLKQRQEELGKEKKGRGCGV